MISQPQETRGCQEANALFLERRVPLSWTPSLIRQPSTAPEIGQTNPSGQRSGPGNPGRAVRINSEPREQVGIVLWVMLPGDRGIYHKM